MFSLAYIAIYVATVGMLIWGGYFLYLQKRDRYRGEKISLEDITVIIPFRNEKERIEELLKSIQESTKLPAKLIFVNDHSEDLGERTIHSSLQSVDHTILDLPDGITGKKSAIRTALAIVETKYVLTLDADVHFSTNYFSSLESLSEAKMWVLPVNIESKNSWQAFLNIDVLLANALNIGITGWKRPIMASGANLLFEKASFDQFDSIEKHQHIASGDDVFLLRDFTKNNLDAKVSVASEVAVSTSAPENLSECINQRARWAGKTKHINDKLNMRLAIFQTIINILFFGLLIFLFTTNWKFALLLFFGKSILDMLFFTPYFFKTKNYQSWILIPFYELFYPFYALMILRKMGGFVWKGR